MRYSPLLLLHISAGMTGLLSGAAAMIFRKGSARHAVAGKVFVAAMLTMAASATYLAMLKHQNDNVGGGILTFYLVATAWITARRRNGGTSILDWAAMLVPSALGILLWFRGIQMVQAGSKEGALPIGMTFFMGSVMVLAAVGDLRMVLRGGIFGTQRVVRHLWRMCLGFFIATGSFFLGQGSKIFPSVFRQSSWLLIPAFLPLLLLVFWVFRVRFAKAFHKYRTKPLARIPDVQSVRT
jgi:uncharacterized membrane protein